jgi:oligopeptide/dipeptide ABC transporter ATP-binding protein
VTVQAQILDLIQAQRKDRNMSVILVTHDLGVVAGHTDEIIVMYAGQIVEQAPTPVLFGEMRMPYTEALLESIPKLDQPSHTLLRAIAGRPPDLINPPKGCRFSPRCPYVQDRCRDEAPPLVEAETPGHLYACWYPVGSDVWQDVKARLIKEGTATIPVSVEAAEPGDVIPDATDAEPVPEVSGETDAAATTEAAPQEPAPQEPAPQEPAPQEPAPHETPASSPGGS